MTHIIRDMGNHSRMVHMHRTVAIELGLRHVRDIQAFCREWHRPGKSMTEPNLWFSTP